MVVIVLTFAQKASPSFSHAIRHHFSQRSRYVVMNSKEIRDNIKPSDRENALSGLQNYGEYERAEPN